MKIKKELTNSNFKSFNRRKSLKETYSELN